MRIMVLGAAALSLCVVGCGSGAGVDPGGSTDAGADSGGWNDPPHDAATDVSWPESDGGYVVPDAGVLPADRFITKVISFTPGDCAGFGVPSMPAVVMGPPIGGGDQEGSLDVLSLGNHGEIVVSFEPNAIVDGPGVDFIVFENAFIIGGDPHHVFAEPGEVAVSDDGVSWTAFPCNKTFSDPWPYGACAGWHPVYSNPATGLSPIDPAVAGGDPFDLADVGVKHARFVRIRDNNAETCPKAGPRSTSNGFDLDAIAIVNAERP